MLLNYSDEERLIFVVVPLYLISDEIKISFDKNSNKPRSKSEVRNKKEEKIRNVETQTGDERSAGLCYYVSYYDCY